MLFLAIRLVDEACAWGFQPNSRIGRNLIYTVGLRRETLEQLPVLISGFAGLIPDRRRPARRGRAVGHAVERRVRQPQRDLLRLQGRRRDDLDRRDRHRDPQFPHHPRDRRAAIQNWLEDRYLPTTRLDSGLRNSIKTSLGYTGFLLALALAAANLGVDFQKLAIVAGALSVGIGFGLQSIVNNFVSGLILLWERAVRVGDWVVVGADQGYVRKINVRSTEIETFDRAAVIVPNSNLVSGVVKNLMRTDRVGRLTIELVVQRFTADPEKVREVLLDIARDNDGHAVAALAAGALHRSDRRAR